MGMQVDDAVAEAHKGQRVSDEIVPIERAENLTAGIRGNDKSGHRLQFQVRFAPHLPLQLHTRLKFGQLDALAHDDGIAHRCWAALPTATATFSEAGTGAGSGVASVLPSLVRLAE